MQNPSFTLSFYVDQERERQRQRTRSYLLFEALRELHPEAQLRLAYSLGDGFYYHIEDQRQLLPREVERLHDAMLRLANQRRRLQPEDIDRDAALTELARSRRHTTHAWVADAPAGAVFFYRDVQGELLAFKGPLCETTAEVEPYALLSYPPGLLLRVLPRDEPEPTPYRERPTLFRSFYEAERWGQVHGTTFVSEVNARIRSGEIDELVRVAEALHARKIADIADRVLDLEPQPRVVLISGPSSSGKTSFSHRLQVQLRLLGLKPQTLSLDDFYKPRDQIPRRANGDYDFEVLEALDVERFDEVLLRLVGGETVQPPKLDFQTHQTSAGSPMKLAANGVLIVEGIHGLNPRLTPHLTEPSVFRIYVSALTHLNFDGLSRMSTTDLRLLRRMVRDRRARGYGAEETLARWPVVREGENLHIFPFQERADVMFNSALPFELNALKLQAIEALAEVKRDDLRTEAQRLQRLLDAVEPLQKSWMQRHLSPTSLMSEFVGGSVLVP